MRRYLEGLSRLLPELPGFPLSRFSTKKKKKVNPSFWEEAGLELFVGVLVCLPKVILK